MSKRYVIVNDEARLDYNELPRLDINYVEWRPVTAWPFGTWFQKRLARVMREEANRLHYLEVK